MSFPARHRVLHVPVCSELSLAKEGRVSFEILKIHNVSRPGLHPETGDIVEIECYGGFVKRVDKATMKLTDKPQRFVVMDDAGDLKAIDEGEVDDQGASESVRRHRQGL